MIIFQCPKCNKDNCYLDFKGQSVNTKLYHVYCGDCGYTDQISVQQNQFQLKEVARSEIQR